MASFVHHIIGFSRTVYVSYVDTFHRTHATFELPLGRILEHLGTNDDDGMMGPSQVLVDSERRDETSFHGWSQVNLCIGIADVSQL